MSEQEKLLAPVRAAIAQESRKLDERRRALKAGEGAFAQALIELRSACPHASAVEIRYEWVDRDAGFYPKPRAVGRRYCLGCGGCEEATTYHLDGDRRSYQYRRFDKAAIVRSEALRDSASYTAALEIFRERLHDQARFDEFDDAGVWHGEKIADDSNIRRGED